MLTMGVRPTPALTSTTGHVLHDSMKPPAGWCELMIAPVSMWSCRKRDAVPLGSSLTLMR